MVDKLIEIIVVALFVFALDSLRSQILAKKYANQLAILGMLLACLFFLQQVQVLYWLFFFGILGGVLGFSLASFLPMTALPELIAFFHSLIGLAAVFVAFAIKLAPLSYGLKLGLANYIEMGLGSYIGSVTFVGSIIAALKLHGLISSKPLIFNNHKELLILTIIKSLICLLVFCYIPHELVLLALNVLGLILGWLLFVPVGGADMPVVVSMLNSYSGFSTAGIGMSLHSNMLIISGSFVGSSGAILSYIMCASMNRSLLKVLFGNFNVVKKVDSDLQPVKDNSKQANIITEKKASELFKESRKIIIVPGYGMAVARAQYAVAQLASLLTARGAEVLYAVHPVAGRMPGHMNVLLAEAKIPYKKIIEADEINPKFAETDLVYVIGANDITNPAAENNPESSIFGMEILKVSDAKKVIFVKRSMGAGYAGEDNELFYSSSTFMLLGDAKNVTENLIKLFEK